MIALFRVPGQEFRPRRIQVEWLIEILPEEAGLHLILWLRHFLSMLKVMKVCTDIFWWVEIVKTIYKTMILARDKPLLFFSISLPLTLLLVAFHTAIYYMFYHMFLNAWGVDNAELVIAVFFIYAPVIPIFVLVTLIFIEYYLHFVFNLIRLSWLLGFDERRLASAFASWAEIRNVAGNNTYGEY